LDITILPNYIFSLEEIMKKTIAAFIGLFFALFFCGAETAGKAGGNGNMKIEKSKLDSSLFKTDAEFMQTFRNFSDGEVPAYAKGKVEEKERNLAVLAALHWTRLFLPAA